MLTKHLQRKFFAAKVLDAPQGSRSNWDKKIFYQLRELCLTNQFNRAGVCPPLPSEPDWQQGPLGVATHEAECLPQSQLSFGLATPQVLLIPGLSFCPYSKRRLGRGGGYFDRYLAQNPQVAAIGYCYQLQLADQTNVWSTDPWDEPVDMIVTETEIIT